jgi:hypothetical protein
VTLLYTVGRTSCSCPALHAGNQGAAAATDVEYVKAVAADRAAAASRPLFATPATGLANTLPSGAQTVLSWIVLAVTVRSHCCVAHASMFYFIEFPCFAFFWSSLHHFVFLNQYNNSFIVYKFNHNCRLYHL